MLKPAPPFEVDSGGRGGIELSLSLSLSSELERSQLLLDASQYLRVRLGLDLLRQ